MLTKRKMLKKAAELGWCTCPLSAPRSGGQTPYAAARQLTSQLADKVWEDEGASQYDQPWGHSRTPKCLSDLAVEIADGDHRAACPCHNQNTAADVHVFETSEEAYDASQDILTAGTYALDGFSFAKFTKNLNIKVPSGTISLDADMRQKHPNQHTGEYLSKWRKTTMIDEFMDKHGLTQYRLAKLLDTTQTTVARWRKKGPANHVIIKLALSELGRRLGEKGSMDR